MQLLASYMPEETNILEDYYGVQLALLVGIYFMCNAEYRPFFAELIETA